MALPSQKRTLNPFRLRSPIPGKLLRGWIFEAAVKLNVWQQLRLEKPRVGRQVGTKDSSSSPYPNWLCESFCVSGRGVTLSFCFYFFLSFLSHWAVSNSLWPHGLQHARLFCPSLSPRVCSNSHPSSWWYHLSILFSVIPFFCLQSFAASGSFPMSQLFTSGGQSFGASASASVLPMNIQGIFPLGLTCLISLQSKDSQESSSAPQFESISSWVLSLLYGPTLTSMHDYWKNHSFDYMDLR